MSTRTHAATPRWLTLDRDERVRVRARPSKNLLLATFAFGAVLLTAFGAVAAVADVGVVTGRYVSFAVLLFVFLLTGLVYLVTRRREYVVTSRRIYEAVGLTSKRVSAVDLENVTDVTVEQSNWQAWLGIGNLRFVTEEDAVRFTAVENPHWIYERALEAMDVGDA